MPDSKNKITWNSFKKQIDKTDEQLSNCNKVVENLTIISQSDLPVAVLQSAKGYLEILSTLNEELTRDVNGAKSLFKLNEGNEFVDLEDEESGPMFTSLVLTMNSNLQDYLSIHSTIVTDLLEPLEEFVGRVKDGDNDGDKNDN